MNESIWLDETETASTNDYSIWEDVFDAVDGLSNTIESIWEDTQEESIFSNATESYSTVVDTTLRSTVTQPVSSSDIEDLFSLLLEKLDAEGHVNLSLAVNGLFSIYTEGL